MKVIATVELELPDDFEPGSKYDWNAQIWEGICDHAIFAHITKYSNYILPGGSSTYPNLYTKEYHALWVKILQESQWKFKYEQ